MEAGRLRSVEGDSQRVAQSERGVVVTTLLLDVDGVLQFRSPDFALAIERDYRWRESYHAFQRDLFADPGYLATLAGEGDFLAVAERILVRHTEGLDASTFLHRWLDENIVPNRTLLDLLTRLDVEQIYLASNQEPRRGTHIEGLYRQHSWLKGVILSHHIGRRKPDPEYFRRLLQTITSDARECLFVDDSSSCVAGAVQVGIPSIQFVDNDQLSAELGARGLMRR